MSAFAGTLGTVASDRVALENSGFNRIAWRFLPILVIAFLLNFIDRTNVSVAALTMNRALGLTGSQFGFGSGLFFVGYCLFDVPSNLMLYRFGARRWLARIMVTWGVASAATAFVVGPNSFYVVRFLVGVAEAGFFPGVAFYLSAWFPREYRAKVLTWFLIAIPGSSLIGGPLSGFLLTLDGSAGMAGWRWLLIVEALPAIVVGLLLLRILADSPRDARWLPQAEREAVVQRLEIEARDQAVHSIAALAPALRDVRVLMLGLVFMTLSIASFGIQLWLPLIIRHQQGQLSDLSVGVISAIPFLFATVAMLLWTTLGGRRGSPAANVACTCVVAAVGCAAALLSTSFAVSLAGVTIALVGINASRGFFWAMPSQFLTGIAGAGGIAFINMIGTTGGFIGPSIMGWLKDVTGSFEAGLACMGTSLLAAAALAGLAGARIRRFGRLGSL